MGFGKEWLCRAHPKVDPFWKVFPGERDKKIPNISQSPQRDPKPPHSRRICPLETPKSHRPHLWNGSEKAWEFLSAPGFLLLGVHPSLAPFALCLQIPFVHLDLPLDCPLYSKPSGIQEKVLSDKNKELAPQDLLLGVEFLLGREAGGDFQGNLHLGRPAFGQQIFLESGVWIWKSCGILMGEKLGKAPPKCKKSQSLLDSQQGGKREYPAVFPCSLPVAVGNDSCKSPGRAMDLHCQAHFHEINVTIKNGDLGRRRKTYGAVPRRAH